MKFLGFIILLWSSLWADFNVTLSDALFRNAGVTVKAISNDGKYILAVYYGAADETIPELELFKNVDGKLQSVATLPLDNFAFHGDVDDCFVDENFELFGVLDDNGKNKARLRLLKLDGDTFKVVKKVFFNDVVPLVLNTNITGDGKFIMMNYTNTQSQGSAISTVKLLNTELETLDEFTINGLSNGPQPFTLKQNCKEKNFFLFGFSVFDLTNFQFEAPALLQVYKVSENKLVLKNEVELPQFPVSYFANSHNKLKPRVAVATVLPLLPGEVSIFQNTSGAQTFIPGDNQNIREYSFNGKTLSLITTTMTDSSPIVSNFFKDGKTLGISKANEIRGSNIPANTFNLTFLTTNKNDQFKAVGNALTVPPENFLVLFSKNGKYMVCGGDPVSTNDGTPDGIFNINLFRVND